MCEHGGFVCVCVNEEENSMLLCNPLSGGVWFRYVVISVNYYGFFEIFPTTPQDGTQCFCTCTTWLLK